MNKLDTYLALQPKRFLFIGVDPQLVKALQRPTASLSQVQLIFAAVAGHPWPATFYRYNLPGAGILHLVSSVLQRFPCLETLDQLQMETVSPITMLQRLQLQAQQNNHQIIDLPGGLGLLQCGREPLYEGNKSAARILPWLLEQGVDLLAEDDSQNPDRPCWILQPNTLQLRNWELQQQVEVLRAQLEQSTRTNSEQTKLATEHRSLLEEADKAKKYQTKLVANLKAQLEQATLPKDDAAKLAADCQGQIPSSTQERERKVKHSIKLQTQLKAISKARAELALGHNEQKILNESLKSKIEQLEIVALKQQQLLNDVEKKRDEALKTAEKRKQRLEQLEQKVAEQSHRQSLLNEELIKTEAQLELIKDVFIRGKNSKKMTQQRMRETEINVSEHRYRSAETLPMEPAGNLASELQIDDNEMILALDELGRSNLLRAKTNWFLGEWKVLAELDIKTLCGHPERDRFSLLAASAHQQLGDHDKALKYTCFALDWGCPLKTIAQVLVAGVHNSLGRAFALKQDKTRVAHHFENAVAISDNKKNALVSHARSVREIARMGLLPQAASLVDKELQKSQSSCERIEHQEARMLVLQTEIEILHHELAIAQQRQQLYRPLGEPASGMTGSESHEWLTVLKKKAVSQLGQDLWVLEKTGYKRNGFFVEFGATNGLLLNNTWLLEKEFGWQGICAEPNPKFFEQLQNNRSCIVAKDCIADETGKEVDFIFADVYGGIAQYADRDKHAEKRKAYANMGKVARLKTVSLHDFLVKYDAPQDIDYMSIDTEGSEYEILQSFPFDQWRIRLMTIEHNFTDRRADISALMERNGYLCIEMQFDDWFSKEY